MSCAGSWGRAEPGAPGLGRIRVSLDGGGWWAAPRAPSTLPLPGKELCCAWSRLVPKNNGGFGPVVQIKRNEEL